VDTPTVAGTGSDGHFGAEQQTNTRSRARGSFKSIRRGQNHARGARSATRCDSWARPAIVRRLLPRFGGSDLPALFGLYRRRRCQLRPRRVRPDPPQYRIGRRGQRCPAGGSPRRAIEHRWRNRSRGAADRVDTRPDRRRQYRRCFRPANARPSEIAGSGGRGSGSGRHHCPEPTRPRPSKNVTAGAHHSGGLRKLRRRVGEPRQVLIASISAPAPRIWIILFML
jgi:hypothetical protein